MSQDSSFYNLEPDKVLNAAETAGFRPTGELFQLNSYENRVFDIKLEEEIEGYSGLKNVIAKFYRPHRWNKSAIQEEHDFLFDLRREGLAAVAPLKLIHFENMWTGFFPKVRGRMPDELLKDDYVKVGRLLARLHNVGAQKKAQHRPSLTTEYYGGWQTLEDLQQWIAPEVRLRYNDAAQEILEAVDGLIDTRSFIRVHGDCHRGNLLHNGQEFYLVDFDDFLNGPVVQDFWMLLPGELYDCEEEVNMLLKGYEELREFPDEQWDWIPLLRGIRIIGYAGWIAKRWSDPSFPRIFPDFGSYRYWAEETEALEKIRSQI